MIAFISLSRISTKPALYISFFCLILCNSIFRFNKNFIPRWIFHQCYVAFSLPTSSEFSLPSNRGDCLEQTYMLVPQGGFRLQLLDHLERPVLDLTPQIGGTEFVRNDVTSQHYQVNFPPDFTCNDCTIRLLRQADEWSNGYRFWSCADIDIKPSKYNRIGYPIHFYRLSEPFSYF